jgi:tRNA1Val (adenine37-N6)-methyltransferase
MAPELDELTDDALTGTFRILQRRAGHRYSLDDTVTAWEAARERPAARDCLDLGTGIGSVLLMLAYKLPQARFAAVEAQAESYALLQQNLARNGVADRVHARHGDLREAALLAELAPAGGFELITGTPPYQPLGQGSVSPDSQRAHARVELRGGVEAYIAAAAPLLAADGVLVVCSDARQPGRVTSAAAGAGLSVYARRQVWPAAQRKAALFTVSCLGRAAAGAGRGCEEREPFVAREADGRRGALALELRRFFDLPSPADEAPSPQLRARQQRPAGAPDVR